MRLEANWVTAQLKRSLVHYFRVSYCPIPISLPGTHIHAYQHTFIYKPLQNILLHLASICSLQLLQSRVHPHELMLIHTLASADAQPHRHARCPHKHLSIYTLICSNVFDAHSHSWRAPSGDAVGSHTKPAGAHSRIFGVDPDPNDEHSQRTLECQNTAHKISRQKYIQCSGDGCLAKT